MVRKMFVIALACVGALALSAGPASAQYGPADVIQIGPSVVGPGGSVTVGGGCFEPGSSVSVTLNPGGVSLGTATADAAGNVSVSVTIPSSTAPGSYTVELSGTGCDGLVLVLSGSLTIAATSTSGTGALPVTGSSNTGLLVGAGAALITAGALVVVATRSRRHAAA